MSTRERSARDPGGTALSGFFVRALFGAAVILAGVLSATSAVRAETVSPDSWVYEALRSFELRGLVRLEPTLPYTFDQCEAYTREIIANVGKEHTALGPRHAFLLERLTKQFVGLRDRPEDRWSKPVHTVREDDRFFATDFQVGGVLERKPDREKGEMNGLFNPDFLLGLGHNVTMETDYRVTLAPEWEANAGGVKASARVKSFRGLTAEFERALLDAGGSWWDVHLGREYAHWGPNLREDLILSRTAGSLDQLGGRITLGRYALSMIQATLYDGDPNQRYLAGHRLTVALPRGAFLGLSETALYAHRDLDYKYLLPLGIFYAEQANEGSNDDNILWALDCKVPLHRGVMLYGQFLVDDFQYQRGSGAGPDRLGFYWAADALFMVWGREMEVSGGSTFVNRFTYGHSGGTQYVAGDGGVRMNPLLGSPMGPDAARDFIKATLGVSSRASLTLEGVRTIYGAGGVLAQGRLLDWIPGTDAGPDFSIWAPALYVKYASVSLRYDLNHGSYVSAGAWVWYRDEDEINLHRKDNLGWLELVLDL